MQSLHSPEGVVYGNGQTLPDATVLDTFDFRQNLLDVDLEHLTKQPNIANVPGFPDCVVRAQPLLLPATGSFAEHVGRGMQHFALLEETGIRVPAQRFVLAKDKNVLAFNPDVDLLFTFVERLEGDTLAHETHADLNRAAITSIAEYALGICGDKQQAHMLGDLTLPRQFTIEQKSPEDQPSLVLHDTDLVFSFFGKKREGMGLAMHGLGESLQTWSNRAQIEAPEPVKKLQKVSEPFFRKLLGLV